MEKNVFSKRINSHSHGIARLFLMVTWEIGTELDADEQLSVWTMLVAGLGWAGLGWAELAGLG